MLIVSDLKKILESVSDSSVVIFESLNENNKANESFSIDSTEQRFDFFILQSKEKN